MKLIIFFFKLLTYILFFFFCSIDEALLQVCSSFWYWHIQSNMWVRLYK
jgi:hypothetical protein